VWGSDYPHADSTFPGALDALRATIAPLDAAQQERILRANAAALYQL
jgi:predicted TIM-barrel fold metal-dependent hydrolase